MRIAALLLALLLAASGAAAGSRTDWTTFAGNMQRNGYNASEHVLTPAAVPGLRLHWAADLGGPILTQPTLLRDVTTASGRRDLVFAATLYGVAVALDAATGAVVWQAQLGVQQSPCADYAASGGQVGVVATPTMQVAKGWLLIVDGLGELHALGLGTGAEAGGFPLDIVDPADQPPLTIVFGSPTLLGDVLYVAVSSACDNKPAHGEVVEVDLDAPQIVRRWFATPPRSPGGGGIWGPGGVSLEPDGSALYAATGNALRKPENFGYAEHVVQLSPDLRVLAADAPPLTGFDVDFGATPLVFDPPGCPPLLAAMNKSGVLFVYDRTQIGNGPLQALQIAQVTDFGDFIGIPAYDPVTDALYLGVPSDEAPYHHGLLALTVGGDCLLVRRWNRRLGLDFPNFNNPMIPPTVAAGVVWYADGDASRLSAFEADSGRLLWDSGKRIKDGIFAAPAVVNGQVFVAAFDHKLYAFGR